MKSNFLLQEAAATIIMTIIIIMIKCTFSSHDLMLSAYTWKDPEQVK